MLRNMKKEQIVRFFATLQAANHEPRSELHYSNPFELLVAVILSAQATDVSVNKATATLFRIANTPQALLQLGQEGLEEHIRTIGLYRSKARHIMQTCQILIDRYNGDVPHSREALQALPGVGRKTANVVLNTAFGELTIAVDTHVLRVSNRTGLAPGKNPLEAERKLLKRVPEEYLQHAHHWLILHGRYVCKARTPECWRCAVADCCDYKPKTANPATANQRARPGKND
jgi:endonuclease-3